MMPPKRPAAAPHVLRGGAGAKAKPKAKPKARGGVLRPGGRGVRPPRRRPSGRDTETPVEVEAELPTGGVVATHLLGPLAW